MLAVLSPELSYSAMTRLCTLSLVDLTDCKVTSSVHWNSVGHWFLLDISCYSVSVNKDEWLYNT